MLSVPVGLQRNIKKTSSQKRLIQSKIFGIHSQFHQRSRIELKVGIISC